MTALGDFRAAKVARLTPGAPTGVTVTTNPAAGPPFILVDVITLDAASGIGAWTGTLPVKCVAPAPGDADAVALLEAMAEHVLAVEGFARLEPGTYRPTADTTLPEYLLTYPVMVPNPNC